MTLRALAICVTVLTASQLLAQAIEHSKPQAESQQASAAKPAPLKQGSGEDGQDVYLQNCARCHNAPDHFSPSISGTVAHHMRVRANLSEKEYKALLLFLNP